jgi:ethanolamine-phosphate phospho-lyase
MSSSTSWILFGGAVFFVLHVMKKQKQRQQQQEECQLLPCSPSVAITTQPSTTITVLSKEDVYIQRQKYFSKSLSISYNNTDPLLIVRGRGTQLYDERNQAYLDTRNNVAHIGHCHPQYVSAIQHQMNVLNTNTRYLHPYICQLAEQLLQTFPTPTGTDLEQPLTKVFFCNSGSEANDLALRLTRAYVLMNHRKQQQEIASALPTAEIITTTANQDDEKKPVMINMIVVDHAYHGHTIATIDISPYKYSHSGEYEHFPFNDTTQLATITPHGQFNIYKVPCPNTYSGVYRNPDTAGKLYAQYVRKACDHCASQDDTNHASRVGAFILEGGMSVGGVIVPPKNYIRDSVRATRRAGGLYIADEVQTGFGRFGTCYWAFQYQHPECDAEGPVLPNPIPDIVTVGKPFGNGMPLAAVITNDKVNQTFEECSVEYFNTFGGNPVCAIAGLTVLDIIEKEQLQRNACMVGIYLKEQLQLLQQTTIPYIGDIRGSGLFIGIEFVLDPILRQPATQITSWLCSHLKDQYHILTSIDGPHNNVIVMKPPMVFTMEDASHFVDCLRQSFIYDLPKLDMITSHTAVHAITPT